MIITGGCHCGNISFVLGWPDDAPEVVARACDCTFCVKHGAAWTSHPHAGLTVSLHQPQSVSRYAFGTGTATFLVCARCGVVPVVVSELGERAHAVVNVHAFDNPESLRITTQSAHFDDEATGTRLERRQRNWISNVTIATAPP